MATLVPGVGERHIRARNAAEAARITEERQAEGQGRQREQPETEGETEHEQGSADAGIGSNAEDTNTTTPPTNEPPAAQVGIEGWNLAIGVLVWLFDACQVVHHSKTFQLAPISVVGNSRENYNYGGYLRL
jgi:hypothetical protein